MMRFRPLLAGTLLFLACAVPPSPPPAAAPEPPPSTATVDRRIPLSSTVTGAGLSFTLRTGAPPPPAPRPAVAAPTPLSAADTERLLNRLPPLPQRKKQAFRGPAEPRPAPTAATVVEQTFPPLASVAPSKVDLTKPLRIVRRAPEGEIKLAPRINVTFSAPVAPLSDHRALTADDVPLIIKPAVPGEWRWSSTRTLVFEPTAERLPLASRFTLQTRPGWTSPFGAKIQEPVSWSFSTPPPSVQRWYPGGTSVDPTAVMAVQIDQRVDPDAVRARLKVSTGDRTFAVRAPTAQELAAVTGLEERWGDALAEGRVVTFVATPPLPLASRIALRLPAGWTSTEGPRPAPKASTHTFKTYSPLKFDKASCYRDPCPPGARMFFRFNNALNADRFESGLVRIEPSIDDVSISPSGNDIVIQGATRGRTTYRVTIDASLTDVHGQRLGAPQVAQIKLGAASPELRVPYERLMVADPATDTYEVWSINYRRLKLRAWKVTADQFVTSNIGRPWRPINNSGLGRPSMTRTVNVPWVADALVRTPIALSELLGRDGPGHVVVDIQPDPKELTGPFKRRPPIIRQWVQKTKLGLQVLVDDTRALAWVTELQSGAPVAGATVTLVPQAQGIAKTTDAGGLAVLALPSRGTEGPQGVTARRGDDIVFVPGNRVYRAGKGLARIAQTERLRMFAFDDRRIYRPGETVRVKGWLRRETPGPNGDILALDGRVESLKAVSSSPQGNQLLSSTLELNPWGGFDLEVPLPDDVNLGEAYIRFYIGDKESVGYHTFDIAAFRRPEFEITVEPDSAPHFVGEYATVTTRAQYYSGGPLADAGVRWLARTTPTSYQPPGRGEYTFRHVKAASREPSGRGESRLYRSTTNAAGQSVLRMEFPGVSPPQPYRVSVQASVSDVNRQEWTGNTQLLVHPAAIYVGLKSKGLPRAGQRTALDGIVVNLDGEPVADRTITATVARVVWELDKRGVYEVKTKDAVPCQAQTGADGRFSCRFTPSKGGRYAVTAKAIDDRGRPTESTLAFWASGRQDVPDRSLGDDGALLMVDKEDYEPGERATVLVQSPFPNAQGLLTVQREGLASYERFTMTGYSHTLSVPVKAQYFPSVELSVELVGKAPRDDDTTEDHPEYASATRTLAVADTARRLKVTATPSAPAVEPGAPLTVDVTVIDGGGTPVPGAEVALVVVDEAVLALTQAKTPDPLARLYRPRRSGVQIARTRDLIRLSGPVEDVGAYSNIDLGGGGRRLRKAVQITASRLEGRPADNAAIEVRKDFSALALFAPEVRTGADGRAKAELTLPDTLTRYRIMAVVADRAQRFGSGESSVTARKVLMARPSPPRFLNYGDDAELPVVIQNQGAQAAEVDVALRGTDAEPQGFRITVPAQDRREVRFPVRAKEAGQAYFQIAAASENADAAQFSLPVYTPATTEAFATYGTMTAGAVAQPLQRPEGVIDAFGGLEITTASTQLQALTDAVLYLQKYPYECSEQIASRVISVAALKDVLAAFEAEGLPEPKAMVEAMARDLERLADLQSEDGGWGFWSPSDRAWPFLSVHVMHALVRARDKGFTVRKDTLLDGTKYLREIRRRFPSRYPKDARRVIEAYALYVRAMMGDLDSTRAKALVKEAGGIQKMPLELAGWLYPVLVDGRGTRTLLAQLRQRLQNDVAETAGEAHFVTAYEDGAHVLLHSERRIDGLLLEGLLRDRPQDPLVPKLVRGLLAHRTKGRWASTQESTWVLLALDRYFRAYEGVTPDFVARLWLGRKFAGEQKYAGRSPDQHRWFIPMAQLAGADRVLVGHEGAGRLYYRLGLKYAPASLTLAPLDRGFAVSRRYEAVEDEGDVQRDADGTWRIRAGALVRVKLSMVAPSRRYHVALTDHLPAGFEALNPALAVNPDLPPVKSQPRLPWWWFRPWYTHQNLGDARVDAFASLVYAGAYEYDYVARATTPGRFIAPPAKAEQMYAPETFGRSGSDRVVIE